MTDEVTIIVEYPHGSISWRYSTASFGAVLASEFELAPHDWPLPHERAHQDALWFCSGGDQLL